ncbi:MAG TPA: right-handed parallel beta-helix repeat-containing protein [Chitinophagaceae bacterium]|nr:right-handed parallel beta-helix repeat-containing protein [Chitinophagaceae bacterium]
MVKYLFLFLSAMFFFHGATAQEKIRNGMLISHSVKFKKGFYKIDATDKLEQPVIIIEGNNITIDFNNAILQGSNSKKNPDEFFGVAILIQNSKYVTIKNLRAKGYKVALLAQNTDDLSIDNCDFSYNYRQHLNSTQEKEDISDWLSHHHNEKDEWLRYGAGMYLRKCDQATITNCKVTGGQNGLMMMECNDGMIYNNDFSFNSGLGIGMYRSSRNKVMYNRLIFNVRGYSEGVYNRGQDSAGILVYEQSDDNLFYKNNVTHGGDGFFLWAGQTTMDNGQGGCNDNVIMGNDFSYAPTNGVEVTFSRNTIVDNRIFECDHGIWGGYSYETNVSNNKFRNNRIAIAIEHGQQNRITYNLFYQDKEAIRLWGNVEEPSDWGYPKYHDTRSKDYIIVSNSINKVPTAFNISRTEDLSVFNNSFNDCDQIFKVDSTVADLDTTFNDELSEKLSSDTSIAIPVVKNPNNPFKGVNELPGRKNILITEWGPYDFRSPIIWNTNPTDTGDVMKFDLLGPKGKWKLKSFRGVENISETAGEFPASITAQKIKADRTDIFIELEYSGSTITTPFGETVPAGKIYSFSFRKFFQPMDWQVNWYGFDSISDPIKHDYLFPAGVKEKSFRSEKTNKLDYAWWGGLKGDDGQQYTRFITVAEANADIPKGVYDLGVTWDDAVRVYIDDKLVIDEWNPSKYDFDESPHKTIRLQLDGNHRFKVEHVELGGFATLSLKLNRIQ